MGATYEGTVALHQTTKKLKPFDLLFTAGHAEGHRNLGIYTLDGDTWTFCLATRGDKRPEKFITRPGTGLALETLVRGTIEASARKRSRTPFTAGKAVRPVFEDGQGPSTEWEGEWAMVSGVFNGKALDSTMLKWCRRVTRGNVTTVVAGPQVMLKATFTLDTSGNPHAVDYVNLEGANAGKPQAGIFELAGGLLKISMSAPGRPRPRDFSSKAGDGRTYTTWRLNKNEGT